MPTPQRRHDRVAVVPAKAGTQVWAIRREKQIKEWKREWKFNLIERDNPRWVDLYPNLEP